MSGCLFASELTLCLTHFTSCLMRMEKPARAPKLFFRSFFLLSTASVRGFMCVLSIQVITIYEGSGCACHLDNSKHNLIAG